jgi:hypothetical protein
MDAEFWWRNEIPAELATSENLTGFRAVGPSPTSGLELAKLRTPKSEDDSRLKIATVN